MIRLLLSSLSLLACACTAPRSILYSPQSLPKGEFEVGVNGDVNLPTQTSDALYGSLDQGIKVLYDNVTSNTVTSITADSLNGFVKALIAYSVDPLGIQPGVYIRYGFWPRLEGGYHRNGSANGYDLRWQFLGPKSKDSVGKKNPWTGSVGAQYSSQSFELPAIAGLDKLQSLLQYNFDRKDILFPLVLGKPIGKNGRFGNFGLGLAYNVSFIEYDSDIRKMVERLENGSTKPFENLHGHKTISAYGGFANTRLGYRWIYLVGSMSAFWQDYGTFNLFGGQKTDLSGWTIIPSLALEFHF